MMTCTKWLLGKQNENQIELTSMYFFQKKQQNLEIINVESHSKIKRRQFKTPILFMCTVLIILTNANICSKPLLASEVEKAHVRNVSFVLGVGVGISTISSCSNDSCRDPAITQLKLCQEIGYHFLRSLTGPVLSIYFAESFLGKTEFKQAGDSQFTFQTGIQIAFDFMIIDYLSMAPLIQVGYALRHPSVDRFFYEDFHYLNIQFGVDIKWIHRNIMIFGLRVIGIDMYINGKYITGKETYDAFSMRYDIMALIGIAI